jgi:hypothetical protein
MRMSLTWLLSSGCFCICLSINTLFCQEPTTTILAERTLRDHRCVRREARSHVINYGVCLGSKPAPTPTLALEQQDQINCTGKCIIGVNLTEYYECEPYEGASCQQSIGSVRILVTHEAQCIPFRGTSCICGTYVELPPERQYEDTIPYITCSGGG